MPSSPDLSGEVLVFSPFATMLAKVFMCTFVLLSHSPSILHLGFFHEGTLSRKTQLSPHKG